MLHHCRIKVEGAVFHQDMIVLNRQLLVRKETITLNYCQLLVLDRPLLNRIAAKHTALRRVVAKWATIFVFGKVLRLCVKLAHQTDAASPTLIEMFGELRALNYQIPVRKSESCEFDEDAVSYLFQE